MCSFYTYIFSIRMIYLCIASTNGVKFCHCTIWINSFLIFNHWLLQRPSLKLLEPAARSAHPNSVRWSAKSSRLSRPRPLTYGTTLPSRRTPTASTRTPSRSSLTLPTKMPKWNWKTSACTCSKTRISIIAKTGWHYILVLSRFNNLNSLDFRVYRKHAGMSSLIEQIRSLRT